MTTWNTTNPTATSWIAPSVLYTYSQTPPLDGSARYGGYPQQNVSITPWAALAPAQAPVTAWQ